MVDMKVIEALQKDLIPDWSIIWNDDPWTRFSDKTIFMAKMETLESTIQLFLHEACHALRGKGGHEIDFWKDLEALILLYTGECLNKHQLKMKQDYLGY